MIGTVRPLTIRSSPRWNGRIIPVRVIWPSGKMQTSSPSSSARPASRNAWRIIFGPPVPAIGIARIAPQEPAEERPRKYSA